VSKPILPNPFESIYGSIFSVIPAVMTCKACRAKNRVKADNKQPRCGKCGLPL
jgi:Zn finger protein HypA/HybF involved in hydrogenase expression